MRKKLPQASGKKLGRALLRLGFILKSQRGSHMKFVRVREVRKDVIIVPNHKNIRTGTLRSILNELPLETDDLLELL